MKRTALLTALALGGCTLFTETHHPTRTAHGALECPSYALPIIDTVLALPTLGIGGLLAYASYNDPELRSATPVALLSLAVGIPYAIGAIVGFRNLPGCKRELRATAH